MFDGNDSVLVIGVGRSGLATAEILRKRGVSVAAYDDKEPAQLEAERRTLERIGVALVDHAQLGDAASASTAAVLSPGVPPTSGAVQTVQAAGVPVYSEIEVAYRISRAPIIAVTGSKGKSTTTALIGHLLRAAGRTVRVGGNIGNPLIRETDAADSDDIVVAEVSSFQLESIRAFKPRTSVLLNISPDHLDRYPSIDEYAEAKYRIFANQGPGDAFVGNLDDGNVARLRDEGTRTIPCASFWFSAEGDPAANALVIGGAIALRESGSTQAAAVLGESEIKLIGRHNIANALAAMLTAHLTGAPLDAIREGLKSFAPLPHRLQVVGTKSGVTWIDDSKASNPAAVISALESFESPIILIAGGKSKRTKFDELASVASERAKAVVLIGETAREIGGNVHNVPVHYADSMQAAVDAAASLAAAGDVVLLSPGGSSFDMFESAEQRGDAFAKCVRARRGRRK